MIEKIITEDVSTDENEVTTIIHSTEIKLFGFRLYKYKFHQKSKIEIVEEEPEEDHKVGFNRKK